MKSINCLSCTLCAALLVSGSSFSSCTQAKEVTVYRDRYGVPSVEGRSLADAVYGLGYAMATDNALQMARNYKQARGRLAEVEGRSQLLTDGFLRSLGVEEEAEKGAASLKGEMALLIRRFCDGANRAIVEQKGKLPPWVEQVTPTDVLALAQLVNMAFPLFDVQGQITSGLGSNQFAVAPKRTADGAALLSIDPHLPWSGVFLWYEFGIYAPGVSARGITFQGLPFPVMGHTDRVAWSMTNNDPDLADLFKVETNPKNANQYSYHGEWRDFEEASYELRWREGSELKSRTQKTKRTAWGPLVPFRPLAVHLEPLGQFALLEQAVAMLRARDAKEFRAALGRRGLSMWNIVYADTKGDIGYQYNARVPRRDTSFDWSKPIPGADPRTKWGDLWPLNALPHVENPASGLLVNANSDPAQTPLGVTISGRWPPYVTTYKPTSRFNRLAELLRTDPKISPEEAMQYGTDTAVPHAARAVKALDGAARDPMARKAVETLKAWDKRADPGSRGTVLYMHWLLAGRDCLWLAEKAWQGEDWSEAEAQTALTALSQAAAEVTQQFGRLDAPWSEVHRVRRGDVAVPVSGFPDFGGGIGTAAVVPNWGALKDGRVECTGGSSFRMVVSLGPKGVRSWSVLPFGNIHNPASAHYADQLPLFAVGKYKDSLFGAARIRREASTRQSLKVEP